MASKWMTELMKKDAAVKWDYNPFSNVLRTGSPTFDYIYGKTHGLPFGYSEVLWGPPKGGKSLAVFMKIGYLHKNDPEAIAVIYNTEFRGELQLTSLMMKQYGIDPDRLIVYNTNRPDEIFDHITGDVAALLQKGMPLRYIAVDSVTSILGRRGMNADTIMTQQIGDNAATLQDGLRDIKATLHNHRVALSLVAQARAELDPVEQMRGNKLKMAGAWALKHHAEYFIFVEQNNSKEGKADLSGNAFEDASKTDVMGHAEKTGHKIRVTMKGNSTGVAGRVGQFTLDYYDGLRNIHEEAFLLGVGQGVVQRPNNVMYVFPDFPGHGETFSIKGKDNFLMALRDNPVLCGEVLKRVRAVDIEAMESGRAPPVPSGSELMESSASASKSQLTDGATAE